MPRRGPALRNEGIKLGFRLGAKRNHASGEDAFGFSSACIRAMLARSRSSTGSSGTVCPAAICASLRARLAATNSGTGLSGDMSFIALVYHGRNNRKTAFSSRRCAHRQRCWCARRHLPVFLDASRCGRLCAPLYGDFFVKRFFTRTLIFFASLVPFLRSVSGRPGLRDREEAVP